MSDGAQALTAPLGNTGGVSGSWDEAPRPEEPRVKVVDPNGRQGTVPVSQLRAAGTKGYRVRMWDTSGKPGSVPVEQMEAATRSGYQISPKTEMEQKAARESQPGLAGAYERTKDFLSGEGRAIKNFGLGTAKFLGDVGDAYLHPGPMANSNLGQDVVGMGKGLYSQGKNLVTHPLRTIEDPEEFTGDVLTGASFAAPFAKGIMPAPESYLGRATSAIGRAADVPAGIVRSAAQRTVEPFGVGVEGARLLKKGVSPRASAIGFDEATRTASPDLVAYNRNSPIKSVADLHEAIPEIQKQIATREMNPVALRHAEEPIAPTRLANVQQAVSDSISPFTEEFEPKAAQDVQELAEKMGKARTVGDIIGRTPDEKGGLLGWINGKLNSYFAKYPSARKADLMTNPDTAAWAAARRSLRDAVLDQLEQGGENGIRAARQRWGALENLGMEVERRVNVADRAKPIGLYRMMGWLSMPATGPLGPILGETARYLNMPDTLVRRGIAKMSGELGTSAPSMASPGIAPLGADIPSGLGTYPFIGRKTLSEVPEETPEEATQRRYQSAQIRTMQQQSPSLAKTSSPESAEVKAIPRAAGRDPESALLRKIDEVKSQLNTARGVKQINRLATKRRELDRRLEEVRKASPKKKVTASAIENEFPPSVLDAANHELRAAMNLWEELPAPERIRVEDRQYADDVLGNPRYRDQWIGVNSPRPSVEAMFPWVKELEGKGLGDLRSAMAKGNGVAYERWLREAARDVQERMRRDPDFAKFVEDQAKQ